MKVWKNNCFKNMLLESPGYTPGFFYSKYKWGISGGLVED
jgi:hypothetical protein